MTHTHTQESGAPQERLARPPSVRGMWTTHINGTLIGAFKTKAELDEWLDWEEERSILLVPKSDLGITRPDGTVYRKAAK